MLSKNEIKLNESRGNIEIRRIAFTPNGYVRLVEDVHFDGVKANEDRSVIKIESTSRTTRLKESDMVIEIQENEQTGDVRTEFYTYTDGRLRSASLSNNFVEITLAMHRNRDIQTWVRSDSILSTRAFGNQSWFIPEAVKDSKAFLKSLIPCEQLWLDQTDVDVDSLVMSYHKLFRLVEKRPMHLTRRNVKTELFTPESIASGHHFLLAARGNKAFPLTEDWAPEGENLIVRIKEIAKVDSEDGISSNVVYNIELVKYVTELPVTP